MRKRLSLAMMLLVVAVATMAQTRYCLSYEDFKNDKWVTLEDSLQMEERTNSQKYWSGGGDIKFTTGNKETDEFLKKEVRFIVHNDKMYVNLRKLKRQKGGAFGNHFALAYRYAEDKVCFAAQRPATTKMFVTGALGGAIGGAVAAANEIGENGCYIMDSDNRKVKQIKAKDMSTLLAESPLGPGLYETYDKNTKESAEVIIRQLKKLDLLKPY